MSGQSALSIKDENERDIPDEIMTAKLLVESNELRDGIRSGGVIGDGGLSPQGDGSKPSTNGSNTSSNTSKPKRTSLACIRCRTRHIRCPGGDPCKKCQLAKTKCEYIEADKKIVVSMKYLSKLHDDIARLKKDNAMLRNNIKDEEKKNLIPPAQPIEQNSFANNIRYSQNNDIQENANNFSNEVIQPSLDKYGRLIQSRTGEKVYVGSSSMTLFGLEIQNMVPSFVSSSLFPNSTQTSPDGSPATTNTPKPHISETTEHSKRETEILEKEGNAYKITLAKTNTRPGMSINFTLPSYSYAMLLVDTFINYNDGCFYFFNEGLVKKFLMNLYSGKTVENKNILKRNISLTRGPAQDENSIKKDTDDDTILETIWFCKILLIFAIGEMYLGTESDTHRDLTKEKKKTKKRNTLPGSGFFYQASELFTGLFASGAIDNITKDGGVEVMLLYAFYLQVADCTIASYFYFGLALRSTLILGWHVDADKENLNRFELEHRRRIWWTVYMYERMLSSKAGLPLSFADDSVSTELPIDFNIDLSDFPKSENDVRGFYIFPSAEYINNCVTITQINAIILSSLYTKQPKVNILPVVSDLVHKLMTWKTLLPEFLRVDFSVENFRVSRLIVNLMTEYFQGMNLAVRPLLFHFATKKLKELQVENSLNKYVDLSKYSKNVLTLLNASFQASINTIKAIWALVPENMVALFGWMDREYLFTSASTLILFNASFGVHEATIQHLDHALVIFTRMKKLGNYPAALRRAQLLKLIKVLDFNGVMNELLVKHDDETKEFGKEDIEIDVNVMTGSNISNEHLNQLDTELKSSLGSMTNMTSTSNSMTNIHQPRGELDFMQFGDTSQTNIGPNQPISANPPNISAHPLNINVSPNNIPSISYSTSPPTSFNMNISQGPNQNGDVYTNSDLAGIEGLTYLDEEQKLWNEITNDAVWLNVSGGNPNQPPNQGQADFFKRQTRSLSDLQGQNHPHPQQPSQESSGYTGSLYGHFQNHVTTGGYSDIINLEFQDMMD